MHFLRRLTLASSLGALVAAAGLVAPPQPAAASDIEVFFSKDLEITAKPNVLFILDTSQSIDRPRPRGDGRRREGFSEEIGGVGPRRTLRDESPAGARRGPCGD